jgi:hypothetical protein
MITARGAGMCSRACTCSCNSQAAQRVQESRGSQVCALLEILELSACESSCILQPTLPMGH